MKTPLAFLVLLLTAATGWSQPSYWFSGWQRKGSAEQAQEYFLFAGTNISFSYATNRVGINLSGSVAASTSTYAQFSTNSSYSSFATNATYSQYATNFVGTNTFCSLMGYVTNTINGGANTYAIVTNYQIARANGMSYSLTAGTITNSTAGYYYCAIHLSGLSVDANALVEGDLLLNGVERDEISFQSQFDPGTPRIKGMSSFGILYINANTQITFQIKSSGAGGTVLRRAQLVVMKQ